jgi:hypothetical protein
MSLAMFESAVLERSNGQRSTQIPQTKRAAKSPTASTGLAPPWERSKTPIRVSLRGTDHRRDVIALRDRYMR